MPKKFSNSSSFEHFFSFFMRNSRLLFRISFENHDFKKNCHFNQKNSVKRFWRKFCSQKWSYSMNSFSQKSLFSNALIFRLNHEILRIFELRINHFSKINLWISTKNCYFASKITSFHMVVFLWWLNICRNGHAKNTSC